MVVLTPLIPALRKEVEAVGLVYRVSSRTALATQRNPVLEKLIAQSQFLLYLFFFFFFEF